MINSKKIQNKAILEQRNHLGEKKKKKQKKKEKKYLFRLNLLGYEEDSFLNSNILSVLSLQVSLMSEYLF